MQRNWESVEEIIGAVLARVRRHDPARRIRSRVPEGLPLIKADPVLLAQLLANLLDNALKYSEGDIELTVQRKPQWIEVGVHDRGPGIRRSPSARRSSSPISAATVPAAAAPAWGWPSAAPSRRRTAPICVLQPRSGGGSSFFLRLPLEAQPHAAELPDAEAA